jgi:hypothetical protein
MGILLHPVTMFEDFFALGTLGGRMWDLILPSSTQRFPNDGHIHSNTRRRAGIRAGCMPVRSMRRRGPTLPDALRSLFGRTAHFAFCQHPPKTNKPRLQVNLLSSFRPAMQKTQLVALVAVLLALVFSSSEAIPCRYCDQQTCRNACLDDLKYCYQWEKDNHKTTPCLSFYYVCNAACAFSPRSADDALENSTTSHDEFPAVSPTNFELPENETAESTPTKSD